MSKADTAFQTLDVVRRRFAAADQDRVFRFWHSLAADGRRRLLDQASRIDLAAVGRAQRALGAPAPAPGALEPPPVLRLAEHGPDARLREQARREGEAMLEAGAVAPVVVAGGQGTRLGFPGPKGAFPIGPVSERSLFELFAQKVRGARRRSGARLPWCVMTSEPTDAAIRDFFTAHEHFGLPAEDVLFFVQASSPALGEDGQLLLEAPDRIATSPEGHGGVLPALADSGVLAALEARGIRWITTFQVDNPLVRVADPVFLGWHALSEAEFSCKAVAKREPGERAGTLALQDGRLRVIEYSEIDDHHRDLRGEDGELAFWAASIGMHVLDLGFVARVAARADEALPYHLARKRVPCLAEDGQRLEPAEPNAYKLERFVFDALAETDRAACLEIRREEEYSPVKNAGGSESPETARHDLRACYRRWLAASGRPAAADVELDHAWIDGPEDAAQADLTAAPPSPPRENPHHENCNATGVSP